MAETQNSKQNVQAPQAGQTVIVNAIPGQDIVLEAAFDQAEVKMDGGNVIFEFANGGQVVLDFSDIGTAQAPNVVMPDGTILNMEEFLASLGEGDVEPAAGPEGGGEGSGGVGEYRDDAGNLIDGVDKLGGLDPRAFSAITVDALEADDLNPLPTAGFVSAAADEDGLVREWFVTPYTGNDDEADGDHPATAAFVKGFLNYDFGGDGPADVLPFTWNLAGLPSVTSQGHTVLYEVTPNGQTLNAYWEFEFQKPVYGQPSDDSEMQLKVYRPEVEFETVVQKVLVFSLELTNLETGEYLFTLYRPLDHSEINTEDDIVYNFSFTVTDGSGDPASGGLNLIIDDDSPVARDTRPIERTVDEDDILTSLSTGNYPNDGTKDGSKTGYLDGWWFNKGPAIVEGSLKSLVSFGADGPGKNGFSLSEDLQKLYDQGLTSKDQDLEYRLAYGGKVLQAFVPGEQGEGDDFAAYKMVDQYPGQGSDDRVVFELWLDNAGNYKFKLYDQLDHYDENDHSLPIDLSSAIVATDGDGDSITLESGFVINVTDDGPKLVGKPIIEKVAENDIDTNWSEGTSPNDGKGWYHDGESWKYDGSYTDDPGNNDPGAAYVRGDLSGVVKFGADELGSFRFSSDAVQKLYSTDFNFWGSSVAVPLEYVIIPNEITGIDTLLGYEKISSPGISNKVFELRLNTHTGEYEFLLHDELRHTGEQSEFIKINFGTLIEAVDRDGDAVSLDGKFLIEVVDDVPSPKISLTQESVLHDETPGVQSGSDDTNRWDVSVRFDGILGFGGVANPGNDNDVPPVYGAIGYAKSDGPVVSTAGSKAGADHLESDGLSLTVLAKDGLSSLQTTEGYAIRLYEEQGRIVGRVDDVDAGSMNGKAAFAVAIGEDGTLYLAQYLSLYHPNDDNPNDTVTLDGQIGVVYTMTDTDGDTRSATVDVGAAVVFADDGPRVWPNDTVYLDDDVLGGNPGGVGDGPDRVNTRGWLNHSFGADGGSISWVEGELEGFTFEKGEGNLLYVMQGDTKVLTLTLNPNNGYYTVTQNAAIKHVEGDNENNQFIDVRYRVTDGDGDSIDGTLKINIDDDTPLARADSGASSALTPATGNLLSNDLVGADKPGKVVSVEGEGPDADGKIIVEGTYGTLTVTAATGEYSYVQTATNVADITVTRLGNDSAGFKNTFGYFVKNSDGTPASGTIIWSNNQDVPLNAAHTIQDVDPSNVGWFLIPNGGELNEIANGQPVTFALIDNEWVAKIGDVVLKSADGQILFNDNALNLGATAQNWGYLINNELNGELNWEDLLGGGDTDNNDVNLGLSVTLERAGTDSFKYVMSDADGDTSSATLTIDPNIAPYAGWSGGWTDEDVPLVIPASLLLGLAQDADGDTLTLVSVGFRDVDGDGTVDGKGATLVDNGNGTFTFTPATDFNGYVDLVYTVSDGTNTSTGVYTIDVKPVDDNRPPVADDEIVSTVQGVPVTIDALEGDTDPDGDPLTITNVTNGTHGTAQIVDGKVVYTPVANPGPNGLVDTLEYTISDGKGGTDTGTITVNISDVGPAANPDTVSVGTRTATVNLVLILDRSGSMAGDRLALMKDAVENLIDSFGSSLVKVMLVPFNADATAATDGGSVWMSGDVAITKINALTATGGTDYDDPISEVMTKYGTPPSADNTYVYFLSDGDPNAGGDNRIDDTERGAWTTFLTTKGVDAAYAVGIGTGVSTTQLLTVAWAPDGNHSGNVFSVTNENDLSGTLELISQSATGDVTTNDVPGLDGFGTPALVSVEFGGTTYTFNQPGNPASYEIPLGPGVGKIVIESDGDYTYTPPVGGAYGAPVVINYILQDADGSTSGSTLTIDPNDLPVANNDTGAASVGFMQASGNITASATVVTAPEAWVQDVPVLFDNSETIYNVNNNDTDSTSSSSFVLTASDVDASHPASVSFTVARGDWTAGDRWTATLMKSVSGPDQVVGTLSAQSGSGAFTIGGITTPGTYYLAFSLAADGSRASGNGRPDLTVSQMKYTAWSFTPETTRTINVTAPNMAWVAAVAAVGNVLVNDDLGVQGAEVASVNFSGTDYGAGESITATYGTLTINANGAFTYTPTAASVPAGTQEVFTYTIEQPDGDFDSATLTIDVAGHAYTATAGNDLLIAPASGGSIDGLGGNDRIVGSDGADTLTGGSGNDYIEGGGGDDVLYGGAGSDYLSGGAGNDTLYGGAGDDILTGGAGSDTFAYTAGDLVGVVNGDIITDFQLGAGGDILDVSALLNGENPGNLGNFLDFEVTNIDTASGTATIQVNVDQNGTSNFNTHLATIEVTGVTAADNADTIIDQMINNHINIDHP